MNSRQFPDIKDINHITLMIRGTPINFVFTINKYAYCIIVVSVHLIHATSVDNHIGL